MTSSTQYKQTEVGEIPENWNVKELGEMVSVIGGAPFKSKDFVSKGFPVLKIANVKPMKLLLDDLDYISNETARKYENAKLKKGDLLVTMTGNRYGGGPDSWVGKVALFNENDNYFLNQRIGILRQKNNNNEVDINFLAYFLGSIDMQRRFVMIATGAGGQANISPTQIKTLKIPLPDLIVQHQITSILSALDDKIEFNRKMNKTLEEMGKALFKRWFVDFEFPNENGKPYKSSGGEMVESELGEIPKGWKVKNLGEMLELVYGKGLREGDRQEGQYPVYGSSGVVGNHIQFLVKAPGIVVGRKGNVGSIFWVDNNFFPIDTTYYVRTNQSMYFAYFALQLCNLSNSDSAVPGLSRGQAYMNPLISPEESILSKYDDIAKPIFNQKKKLKEEIETLSQIRDSLLPRLMSGKLRVPKKGELNG